MTRPFSSRSEPRTVEATSTARLSGVPAGKTSTISPPRTASASPSSSPVSLTPPSPRKAASILTRRMHQVWPIGLLMAALAVEAGMLRVGIDDLDEGYFIQQATRVLHGQVPFRDFATLYSPGLAYLHALVFAATGGPSLLAVRVVSLLARAALVMALFGITRHFVRNPWWAAAPGLVLLVGLDDAPVRWEPHPGWLSSLFAVCAKWSLSRGRLASSGILAAAAYAFKQNTGLFILAAVLITARPRWYLPFGAFVATTAVWLIPLIASGVQP